MYQMNDEERAERARAKALHQAVRGDMNAIRLHLAPEDATDAEQAKRIHALDARPIYADHRHMLLAWAFVRGLPYRRVERSHHKQVRDDGSMYEHNLPNGAKIARIVALYLPEFASETSGYVTINDGCVKTWLADPSGAIPAPAPRPKRVYQHPVAAE